jgi:predicted transcriptional regulator
MLQQNVVWETTRIIWQRFAPKTVQPPWWSEYDDPILEFLADCGAAVPPRVILFNLEYRNQASPHRSTVKRRLSRLSEHEFVEEVNDSGYYIITEKGRRYLANEI